MAADEEATDEGKKGFGLLPHITAVFFSRVAAVNCCSPESPCLLPQDTKRTRRWLRWTCLHLGAVAAASQGADRSLENKQGRHNTVLPSRVLTSPFTPISRNYDVITAGHVNNRKWVSHNKQVVLVGHRHGYSIRVWQHPPSHPTSTYSQTYLTYFPGPHFTLMIHSQGEILAGACCRSR